MLENKGSTEKKGQDGNALILPSIESPKGGGAIRGIGEKFQVNAVTGTCSLTLPLPVSPARGVEPAVSLSYDSGSGNGPFGLGWTLSVPSVTRKTSRLYPRYRDAETPDVFLLSGAEDLAPALEESGEEWIPVTDSRDGYTVTQYMPRTEGLWALIEKWEGTDPADVFWKTVSSANLTSWYGASAESRISDPDDESHIFSWLLSKTSDAAGNIALYSYKQENSTGLDSRLSYEGPRIQQNKWAQRYLKKISYGNQTPGNDSEFHFDLVFDYGDHSDAAPGVEPDQDWPARQDPFSFNKSGFEIRTHRLCRRALLFHSFTELGATPVLVRSLDLEYAESDSVSLLIAATQSGYIRRDDGTYSQKSFPPVEFTWQEPEFSEEVHTLSSDALPFLRDGFDSATARFTDLDGEGIAGLLTLREGAWYYSNNLGGGSFSPPRCVAEAPMPVSTDGTFVLSDLDGDGRKELSALYGNAQGYFPLRDGNWEHFVPFANQLNINLTDPAVRMLDLNGDGIADVLMTGDEVWCMYYAEGLNGFSQKEKVFLKDREENGPRVVFSDLQNTIFLADMSGSGMTDIVRIRNGSVSYWPHLGYGQFGPKVEMENAPVFDAPDIFDASRILPGDIDGSGTTDILYHSASGVKVWFNQSGNSFSEAMQLPPLPDTAEPSSISFADLLGTGMMCLVWSSPLPAFEGHQVQYIDLLNSRKPLLITSMTNNLGSRTDYTFTSSVEYYLDDQRSGTPWITRIPFPVQVVAQVVSEDEITGASLTTSYTYHHGYYDAEEKEFRGFGRVEQTDAEVVDEWKEGESTDIPPALTITWFHTGAYMHAGIISAQYLAEYYAGDASALLLPDSVIEGESGYSYAEVREALRMLRGKPLRSETYSLDGSAEESIPYSVTESNYMVRRIQPHGENPFAVWQALPRESVMISYERDADDPRISHSFTLETDAFGNVLKSVTVFYPRRDTGDTDARQLKLYATATLSDVANETESFRRIGVPVQARAFELSGLSPADGNYFTFGEMETALESAFVDAAIVPYGTEFTTGVQARLYQWQKFYYWENETTALAFGEISALNLPRKITSAVFPEGYASTVYGDRYDVSYLEDAGYINEADYWWNPGSELFYQASAGFYLPYQSADPFGAETTITWDAYYLQITGAEDAVGNVVASVPDYRSLSPAAITDPNGNVSEILKDELGMVRATTMYGMEGGVARGDDPLSAWEAPASETVDDILANPLEYLQEATTYFYYDLTAWKEREQPPLFLSVVRETHVSELSGADTEVQIALGYSDGFGRMLQQKVKTDAGTAWVKQVDGTLAEEETETRWLASGRVVYNNKQKPVKQYEPFFSGSHEYESEPELDTYGYTSTLYYDPIGREIKVVSPKGFFSKAEISAWSTKAWDMNDTVDESEYYLSSLPRMSDTDFEDEADALTKALDHAGTPSESLFDAMGRAYRTVTYAEAGTPIYNDSEFDINGKPLTLTDSRQVNANVSRAEDAQVYNFEYEYDMAGALLHTLSADAGESFLLSNAAGKPVHTWNGRGYHTFMEYDALQRPLTMTTDLNGADERLEQRTIYGESEPSPETYNLRGQIAWQYDSAGLTQFSAYSIAGKVLSQTQALRTAYKTEVDWNAESVDTETFTSVWKYDALQRVMTHTKPDNSITTYGYLRSGQLNSVQVQLKGETSATPFVESISYNAKGQREKIVYGNSVHTQYGYEAETFRLTSLKSTKQNGDGTLTTFQDIVYTYDPVGNITRMYDNSFETVFTSSQVVEPLSDYTYDALYRLTASSGREHPALGQNDYRESEYKQSQFISLNDTLQLQNYSQSYTYDDAGNLTQIRHTASDSVRSWTRDIYVSETSNRALDFEPSASETVDDYFDEAGNMLKLDHLEGLTWNSRNQLASAVVIERATGSDAEYYVYDGGGNRVRKVHETYNSSGELLEKTEKLYLGGIEIKRIYSGTSETKILDRASVHVMDDTKRIAIAHYWDMDTHARETDYEDAHRIHYQMGNHLGSASLELSDEAEVINYEEYFAYGGTSFIAGDDVKGYAAKEYRYSGKECDDTTSLYYYGARYYAPWMCRWLNPDPAGTVDGLNVFAFVRGNPVKLIDPDGKAPLETVPTGIGHHYVPQEIFAGKGLQQSTFDFFAGAATGKPDTLDVLKSHQSMGGHPEYNKAVQELWDDFLLKKGISPGAMTADHAREFLERVVSSTDARIADPLRAIHGEIGRTGVMPGTSSTIGAGSRFRAGLDAAKEVAAGIYRYREITVIRIPKGSADGFKTIKNAFSGSTTSVNNFSRSARRGSASVGTLVFLAVAIGGTAYFVENPEQFDALLDAAPDIAMGLAVDAVAMRLMGPGGAFLSMCSDNPHNACHRPPKIEEFMRERTPDYVQQETVPTFWGYGWNYTRYTYDPVVYKQVEELLYSTTPIQIEFYE